MRAVVVEQMLFDVGVVLGQVLQGVVYGRAADFDLFFVHRVPLHRGRYDNLHGHGRLLNHNRVRVKTAAVVAQTASCSFRAAGRARPRQ